MSFDGATRAYRNVTFLSDYGLGSPTIARVRSAILSQVPGVCITDLSHSVQPFNIREAAYVLCESAGDLLPGIVLAIVDAHCAQRAIAVSIGNGESILVGPDNGVLAPLAALAGGPDAAYVLNDSRATKTLGTTGVDMFAPAVANLCAFGSLETVGCAVDAGDLVPAVMPYAVSNGSTISSTVLHVDPFGNVVLDADSSFLSNCQHVVIEAGTKTQRADVSTSFNSDNAIYVYANHLELVAIASRRANVAQSLELVVGAEVTLRKSLV